MDLLGWVCFWRSFLRSSSLSMVMGGRGGVLRWVDEDVSGLDDYGIQIWMSMTPSRYRIISRSTSDSRTCPLSALLHSGWKTEDPPPSTNRSTAESWIMYGKLPNSVLWSPVLKTRGFWKGYSSRSSKATLDSLDCFLLLEFGLCYLVRMAWRWHGDMASLRPLCHLWAWTAKSRTWECTHYNQRAGQRLFVRKSLMKTSF